MSIQETIQSIISINRKNAKASTGRIYSFELEEPTGEDACLPANDMSAIRESQYTYAEI